MLQPVKITTLSFIISLTTFFSFVCSYFGNLAINNSNQYLAVIAVAFIDGIFGIIAGTRTEGFKTYKALKVLKTSATWVIILTLLLMVELGFKGTSWLSETVLIPFIIFEIISILKNASTAGYIKHSVLQEILKKIDQHKNINYEKNN
jgi:phage-related holin